MPVSKKSMMSSKPRSTKVLQNRRSSKILSKKSISVRRRSFAFLRLNLRLREKRNASVLLTSSESLKRTSNASNKN